MPGERGGGGGGLPNPAARRKEAGGGAWKGKPGRRDGLSEGSQVGSGRRAVSSSLQAAPRPGGLSCSKTEGGSRGPRLAQAAAPGALRVSVRA